MPRRTGVVTADEFAHLPDDDFRYELVAGVVHRMSPVGARHGVVTLRLGAALTAWADRQQAGAVMTETGFVLATNPDTVRAPDLSFVIRERIPPGGLPDSLWRGAPDLAVEVLSPDDRQADVAAKVRQYLSHGVTLVWVIDPSARTVTVHRPATPPEILTGDSMLDGGNVLAGFEVPTGRLFSEI
jgi:Uma2 family endonuclease